MLCQNTCDVPFGITAIVSLAAVGRRRRAARAQADDHSAPTDSAVLVTRVLPSVMRIRFAARQAPQARRVSAHHGVPLRGGPPPRYSSTSEIGAAVIGGHACTPANQSRRAIDARQSSRTRRRDTDGCRPASSASSPLRSRAPTACRTPSGEFASSRIPFSQSRISPGPNIRLRQMIEDETLPRESRDELRSDRKVFRDK